MADGLTSYDTFREMARGRRVVPVSETLSLDTETPVSIYLKMRSASEFSFLFESVEGGRTLGRYSMVGIDPIASIGIRDGKAACKALRPEGSFLEDVCASSRDPLSLLRSAVESVSSVGVPGQPRFTGGWVGYFGYDSVRFVERISLPERSPSDPPDVMLALFMDVVVVDNVSRTVTFLSNVLVAGPGENGTDLRRSYGNACARIRHMRELVSHPVPPEAAPSNDGNLQDEGVGKEMYEKWVETGKEYIRAGDIFQVVLSRRKTIRLKVDPLMVYRALRRINPSPYMYFLSLGRLSVIGSSPEMLLRVENGTVQTRPIAGTRPRGADEELDASVEADLRADEKEKAEHLMLVDLARNDLGKICEPGTVRVSEFMNVERFSHVMHLCSTVSGKLADGYSPVDALYACFPAGTLSGAPKVRAMEIISELETERRGVYGGAIGYIDFSGNLETCIAIRTIIAQEDEYRVQAGAGIVYDSVPEKEYRETADKMGALLEALKSSGYSEEAG